MVKEDAYGCQEIDIAIRTDTALNEMAIDLFLDDVVRIMKKHLVGGRLATNTGVRREIIIDFTPEPEEDTPKQIEGVDNLTEFERRNQQYLKSGKKQLPEKKKQLPEAKKGGSICLKE